MSRSGLSRSASLRRPELPSRTASTQADVPPADAAKSDAIAIDDVFEKVEETGTLAGAAKKLAEIAATRPPPAVVQRRQAWWDDPEEQEFLAQAEDEAEQEEEEEFEYEDTQIEHMNEVVDGLWIGDLVSAMDTEGLRERGISNVVSLLRPRLEFTPDIACYSVEIDDAPDTDILMHLPSTSAWIAEALQSRAGYVSEERSGDIAPDAGKTHPGGVLVHCQAGMSRSATVVAAYLMRELRLDPVEAVTFLREKRPVVDPSETFWHQLGLYYLADGRVTLKDRATRQFYLERTTGMVMNDGIRPSTEHMARYPATPTPSQPPTPAGGHGRRKIRCKMCRHHLAVREHMMDHILDQSPVSRPRTPSNLSLPGALGAGLSAMTPADEHAVDDEDEPKGSRRPSVASEIINPLTGLPVSLSRRPSVVASVTGTPEGGTPNVRSRSGSRLGSFGAFGGLGGPESMAMTRADSAPGPSPSEDKDKKLVKSPEEIENPLEKKRPGRPILDADQLAARLPPQLAALRAGSGGLPSIGSSPDVSSPSSPDELPRRGSSSARGSMPSMLPMIASGGPPILVNPKCSGYFVEPLTWMEPMIGTGEVSGKIVCPNPKCGVKIGNFDWAGVQCGCKEWVTPGFCIARSKVDEVW